MLSRGYPHPEERPKGASRSTHDRDAALRLNSYPGAAAASASNALVCVGVVTGPHGVNGAVRIKSFTARPEDVAGYGPLVDQSGTRCLELRLLGAAKGVLIGRFADVDDRNRAEALRGQYLYLPRTALPPPEEEEYYHVDLIGLDAMLIGGECLGRLRAIHDFGAGDTLEIERRGAPPIMVPFTRIAVPVIDIEGGQIVIDPPQGLLDPIKQDPLAPHPPPQTGSGDPRVPPPDQVRGRPPPCVKGLVRSHDFRRITDRLRNKFGDSVSPSPSMGEPPDGRPLRRAFRGSGGDERRGDEQPQGQKPAATVLSPGTEASSEASPPPDPAPPRGWEPVGDL